MAELIAALVELLVTIVWFALELIGVLFQIVGAAIEFIIEAIVGGTSPPTNQSSQAAEATSLSVKESE